MLRGAFACGLAPVHEAERLLVELRSLPSWYEGSHHFLVDGFATAVATGSLPSL